jgi:hypothetical protein
LSSFVQDPNGHDLIDATVLARPVIFQMIVLMLGFFCRLELANILPYNLRRKDMASSSIRPGYRRRKGDAERDISVRFATLAATVVAMRTRRLRRGCKEDAG